MRDLFVEIGVFKHSSMCHTWRTSALQRGPWVLRWHLPQSGATLLASLISRCAEHVGDLLQLMQHVPTLQIAAEEVSGGEENAQVTFNNNKEKPSPLV